MTKKTIAKLTAIFMLALAIMFPLMSTKEVQAASTKYVIVDTYTIFNGTMDQISAQLNQYLTDHPTYFYSMSKYEGTLNITGVYVEYTTSTGYNTYSQKFRIRYGGNVTEIIYSKQVTQYVTKDFVATSDADAELQLSMYLPYNYSIYYNDGQYTGYLGFSGAQLLYVFPYGSNGNYLYRYEIKYSGTVVY